MRFLSFLRDSKSNQYDLANWEIILIREMKHYKLQSARKRRKEMPKYEADY